MTHRASKSLSGGWQYAQVDLLAVRADGSPTAGTIKQASGVTSLTSSGYACLVQGATLNASGAVWWRHRIEARDAVRLRNAAAVVSARAYQDTGAAVTYTVTVNKPNAADDYSAVTQIATGTVSIANASNADLTFAIADLGDCSNGLEILIKAACGAVSNKWFYLGDLQLEPGTAKTAFERRPMALETHLVARFLRACTGLVGKANSGTNIQIPLSHPDLRTVPGYEATAALAFTDAVTADFTQSQASITTIHDRTADNGRVSCGFFSGLTSGGYGQSLFGVGDGSVIQAREAPWDGNALPAYPSTFDAIELRDGYCHVHDLKIVGGASAVKLYGRTGPCVRNVIENLTIWDALIGLTLDGYDNPDKPTYWNHFARILIARPGLHGVLMTVESTGDTPNANKFHDVRVYSLSAPLTGCGFFLSTARFHNSFIDCEANVSPTAEACFRLGALTDQTRIINFYAECSGAVPGIRIDRSSQNTTIINLFSATGGAPIWDTSGARAYTAVNAGYPTKTLLHDALATDLRVEGFAVETTYAEPASGGLVQTDLTKSSVWLVSAFGGPVEVRLPHAADAKGRRVTIKKTDLSMNPVTVTETSGPGPDGRTVLLGSRYDHVEVVSNGAGWWIVAGNILPGNVRFYDGVTGVIALDLGQNFYAISAQNGAVEARLPTPGDAQAAGRRITIKKTDASVNAITVTCVSGGGPDGRPAVLRYQYDSIDVVSNGAAWFIAALVANYGDVEYIEGVSPITGKAGRSLYTVSAYTGVTEFRLPDPSLPTAVGKPMTIKKADQTDHAVWVTAEVGNGPEGRRVILSAQGDYVTVISDGAGWHTVGASTPTVGAAYIEGTAGFWVDTARPLCLVSAWTGQATATLPAPGSPEGWGRQVTIKKVDSSNNPVLVVADGSSGPDDAMVVLGKFGDFVSVISNGAQWYIASRCYDTPITGWASPDGGGFNRGVYNSDEISNVGWEYSRDVVNAINYRLLTTRDVLRALILDLKMKGVIAD